MVIPQSIFTLCRDIRLPELLLYPGYAFAGAVLAGRDFTAFELFRLALVCIFARICASELRRGVRMISGVLALLASAYSMITLPLTCILILLLTLMRKNDSGRMKAVLAGGCAACDILLGMQMPGGRQAVILAGVFLSGMCLYAAGLTRSAEEKTDRLAKRPGGYTMFAGALLAYLTLFARIGFQKMEGWTSWLPGLLSAGTAAIFLILSWKAMNVFKRHALPGTVKGWICALNINIFFIQAAAVSAAGYWAPALLILLFMSGSRILHVKLYGGD